MEDPMPKPKLRARRTGGNNRKLLVCTSDRSPLGGMDDMQEGTLGRTSRRPISEAMGTVLVVPT
eukprot:3643066-Amphidinium_carterae.1